MHCGVHQEGNPHLAELWGQHKSLTSRVPPPLPGAVLQKAAGYHLDLFWVGILMAVCSFMGLPWYVAATVISIAHIDSLKMETETSAPGEQPQFLGVR